MSLIRRQTALAWELRGHLLYGREIVLALGDERRLRGYVIAVSASGVSAEIDDARWEEPRVVPLSMILSVRRPHFHEDANPFYGERRFEPVRDPDPMEGQLRLGGKVGDVTRRSRAAAARAEGMLLPQDLLDVLAALDRAVHRKIAVGTASVAKKLGRSPQWTVRRLARLAELRLVFVTRERNRYSWAPGE